VLDLMHGGSLNDLLEEREQLDFTEIQIIMKKLMEGVAYMHLNGVMHRDLKPENIMFQN
jgi:serine/threonine protein kinase